MASITIYKLPQVLNLVMGGTGAANMNFPMNRADFRLYKNVTTNVEIYVRDVDRKPIILVGKQLTLNIVDDRRSVLMKSYDLAVVDEYRGLCRLTVPAADVLDWETGYYTYSVTTLNEDGSHSLLYVDLGRGARGTLELFDGPVPAPRAAKAVLAADLIPTSWGYPPVNYRVTTDLTGPAPDGNASGLQTVAAYFTNYTGKFWMQATLDNQPPSADSEWFYVKLTPTTDEIDLVGYTGIKSVEVIGNFTFVRFVLLDDINNRGTFDQVLYRN